MTLRTALVLGAFLSALSWSSTAHAQCGGAQLCSPGAGDCVVSASCTITANGSVIDLGTRRLVITKTLTIQGSGVTINAGSVLLDGGDIVAPGSDGFGGDVFVTAQTSFVARNNALIDVSGGLAAGVVDIEVPNGDLAFSGKIKANGTTRDGDGGDVTLFALGSVTVDGGTLDVSGGDRSFAGSLDISGFDGSLLVAASMQASGGDGGDVTLGAGTTLETTVTATIDVAATGDAGDGGSIDISAEGDIAVASAVTGAGAVSADPDFSVGGDGADYSIDSTDGSVTVTGAADLDGAAEGNGGSVDFEAGLDLTVSKPVSLHTAGEDGTGGDVILEAGRTLTLTQTINAAGDDFGGSIDVEAGGAVSVSGDLLADGSAFAGFVLIIGCTVDIGPQAELSSLGPVPLPFPGGITSIQAGSTMTIAGTLRAGVANQLTYRMPPAPVTTGALIVPAPTVTQDPSIPCCVGCPVTTTTSTTTTLRPTTTTSTTATLPSTTTTTLQSPTTTTLPVTTTTSTTTSSTVAPTSSTTTSTSTTTTTSTAQASTTSTSSTTTTSTSSTTTSSTSTTSTAPPHDGAPTTSSSTSSTVPPPTSSTTTTPVSTTTTTTETPDCREQPLDGFDAVDCRLDHVSVAMTSIPTASFGGTRKTHMLLGRITKARTLIRAAKLGQKMKPRLRSTRRQLRSFDRVLGQAIKKGKTPADVGAYLTELVREALAEVDRLAATAAAH